MEDTHTFKCLVLYTSQSGIADQKVHQEHLFRLLQGPFASAVLLPITLSCTPPLPHTAHKIGYDVVDGATAINKEKRNR